MKKKYWIIIVIFAVFFWLSSSALFTKEEVSNAQVADIETQKLIEERQKLIERDQNVPKEKVEKAHVEAKKIIDDISKVMAKNKPKFKVSNRYSSHLISSNPGRLGETLDDISWRSARTKIRVQINLGFNKEEEMVRFHKGLNGISMGDFFPIPSIGDEAILVKNVTANTKMTSVGLHFVKGRARVSIYVNNYGRKTEKNEKELMEIAKLIEPLINARPNFDD